MVLISTPVAVGSGDHAVQRLPGTTTVKYDAISDTQYQEMWANIYMVRSSSCRGHTDRRQDRYHGQRRTVPRRRRLRVRSPQVHRGEQPVLRRTGAGSLEFSVDTTASTPGTQAGCIVHGCYGPPSSYLAVAMVRSPVRGDGAPGSAGGRVLNMINFDTGQLFDWFLAGDTAFALIERLPSTVTGNPALDWTSLIPRSSKRSRSSRARRTTSLSATHAVPARRESSTLDGMLFTSVDNAESRRQARRSVHRLCAVARQGEQLKDRLDSFVIGHGLFSLRRLPYQHPDAPELSVSILMSERPVRAGAIGTWNKFCGHHQDELGIVRSVPSRPSRGGIGRATHCGIPGPIRVMRAYSSLRTHSSVEVSRVHHR